MKQWGVRVCGLLYLMTAILFFTGCPTDTDSDRDAEKPIISTHPVDMVSYIQGATATALSVEVTVGDEGTLSYQWFKNGTPISGGTAKSYTPSTDILGEFGYFVEVTNTNDAVNGVKTVTTRSTGARVVISETPIILWKVEADGEADKTTSTTLTFTFTDPVDGLTAEAITLTNANAPVTKGNLTSSNEGGGLSGLWP